MELNKKEIENLLPHREPMLLIDKLTNIVPLKSATAIMLVKKKVLIFTATYNEKDNIEHLIDSINKINPKVDIFIIDDQSPDFTYEKIRDLPFNKFQTGFTLNAGNNTWNLGLYLGLQPLFRDNFVENNQMIKNIKQFKVGLVFYIF